MTAAAPADHRRPAFVLLALLLAALAIEGGCRLIEAAENALARRRNPFVEAINPAPAFEVNESGGVRQVRRTTNHPLLVSTGLVFPLERPPGGLRVFVLGGSAAAGWPYQLGETNISALLKAKLQALQPGRPVEVFNVAAGTYGSHRVKLILEEVLRYQPDLLVLYNGNNEFLENLVFRPPAPPAPFDRVAAARLAWRVATSLTSSLPRFDVQKYDFDDQRANHLSFAFGKASRYREDPRQFETLLAHYRFNLESMVASAAGAKVPLLLLTCPVNLRDWEPNVSRHAKGLDAAALARFTEAFRAGYLALEQGRPGEAVGLLHKAVAADDEHAEAHYRLATALRQTGALAEAKAEYVRALQRDAFPFRELPEFQAILREVAARTGAPLVDVLPALEATARDGIPGLDVFIDYVHLTEQSQELVAQEVVQGLQARGLLPGVTAEQAAAARLEIPGGFLAERDIYAADVNFNLAMLMHQYDHLESRYREAAAIFEQAAREKPELAAHCRERITTYRQVLQTAMAYSRVLRAEKLGLLKETFTQEEAQAIFVRYTDMIHWTNAEHLTREEFLREVSRLQPR